RRDIQAFDKLFNSGGIFFHFIYAEDQLRNDTHLLADPLTQRLADFLLVRIEGFQYCLLIFYKHHADENPCNRKVCTHLYFGNRDEYVVKKPALILLKDVAEFFLYE